MVAAVLHSMLSKREEEEVPSEHGVFISGLLLLGMIACSLNLAHFLKHKNFNYLGESAVYILFGLSVSTLWTSMSYDPGNKLIQLNSQFFSLVLLPPIIFEGGYGVQRKMFFQNIVPILGLALIGGFFSTVVISLLMWLFSWLFSSVGWSLIECLVFGSLISSTDPVTVLSLLPSNVDRRLYMFIFGESALNDAISIILYRFFLALQNESSSGGVGILPFLLSFFASLGVFIGSLAVGMAMALIFAKITKHVWISGYEGAIYEMLMMVVFAYSSYLMAEVLSLTGIISIFFCGIGMAHYATPNLTELTSKTIIVTLRVINIMFEGFIFLYLGLGLLSFGVDYEPVFIIAAIFTIFVGRLHVFGVCWATQYLPGSKPVPWNHQLLLWFSGLRGAVSFALAVSFLENPHFSTQIKSAIFSTTVMVILFTVLILGGFTPALINWLKIIPEDPEPMKHRPSLHSLHFIDHNVDSPEPGVDQSISDDDLQQPLFGWLYRLDVKYVRPFFTHQTDEEIQKIEMVKRHDSRTRMNGLTEVMSPGSYNKLDDLVDSVKQKTGQAPEMSTVNLN